MSNTPIPAIIVSGLRGGGGKTITALSLTALLKTNNYNVTCFKKGPDYIDAGWLAKASGRHCYNLDTFMMTPEQALRSYIEHSSEADITVIEGNRGLFDGVDHKGTYSTAELAKLLQIPVIITVDCTKTTNTIAALVLGCQTMDPEVQIGGIVLNRIATSRQESVIRRAIEERCGLPVVGAIPRLKNDPFPERHMGLTPFQEHKGIEESISAVGELGTNYLDLDAILAIAKTSGPLSANHPESEHPSPITPRPSPQIGIIRDSAFQFYYQENLEELEKRGAEIIEVSPLKEKALPDIDALYIGGGFPETHAIALADNIEFRRSLCTEIEKGLPVYAECGGLMYLGESITLENKTYPMVGIFPIKFGMRKKPNAHGYTIVEAGTNNPYFREGTILKGHEFHYSEVLSINEKNLQMGFTNKRGRGIIDNKDGICYKNVLAAYTHLHAVGSPEWADGIIKCAVRYKNS